MAERVGFSVAYLVGFRVAHLVDAWSGRLMLDVAGFWFLVAVAEGDGGQKAGTWHRQAQSSRIIGLTTRCLLLIRLFDWRGRRRRRRRALVVGAFESRAVK